MKIFTDNIEPTALRQIERLMALPAFSGCKVRIMPDVHTGAGCVIGFTGDLGDKVIPDIVGVDIGCGMRVLPMRLRGGINFHSFNEWIVRHIPAGMETRTDLPASLTDEDMDVYRRARELSNALRCYRDLKNRKRVYKSIGTLGGGNHFIEIDIDTAGMTYLVVHTGSRNLGKQVADIYQKLAVKCFSGWDELMRRQNEMIAEYKAAGRKSELQAAIGVLHRSFTMRRPPVPEELCWLSGQCREDYLHDMRLCQEWAVLNRTPSSPASSRGRHLKSPGRACTTISARTTSSARAPSRPEKASGASYRSTCATARSSAAARATRTGTAPPPTARDVC